MNRALAATIVAIATCLTLSVPAARAADTVLTDPPRDPAHPARSEVLHIPSAGLEINGLAYVASGQGVHPTLVICHGWPGNEKNLDLAQAVRRAGWNAITFNYRGSWGSPGEFHFSQVSEDAAAVVAWLRRPDVAAKLGIDTRRIAMAGHSMGGWATARAAALDSTLLGAILIAPGDMGSLGKRPREDVLKAAAGNAETLATTAQKMADELIAHSDANALTQAAPGLAKIPVLVLTADDGGAGRADALVAAIRAHGGTRVQTQHFTTDHAWNDSRLALQSTIIAWLQALPSQTSADLTEVAFVANAEAGTVALVDVASRSIIGVLDINPARAERKGPGATNYAQDTDVSSDGRTIYVSRGYLGDVAAFDLSSAKLLWQQSLNTGRADHMTVTADGRNLFVSALMDNRVYKLATSTGEIDGHVVTGIYPHDVKVSKDGQRLYNSSLGPLGSLPRSAGAAPLDEKPGDPFQLTIADVETLAVRDRIKLDNAFRPWQFSKDEKLIYAQRSNEHAVITYDLASRKVIRRLELPVKPGVTVADWDFEAPHHGLALTEDGETLCLAARASDYAALVNAKDLTLIATIPVGDAPGWSEVAEEGKTCLIANTRSDELSIVSIPKRAEVARLAIGNGPKHITVARVPKAVIAAFKAASTSAPR